MKQIEHVINEGLNTVQALFGGLFTLHYCGSQVNKYRDIANFFHDNSFCDMVKLQLGDDITPCTEFDMITVRTECLKRKEPFFKICPFGAFEIVTPFFDENELKMVLFHGPFKLNDSHEDSRIMSHGLHHKSTSKLNSSLEYFPEITLQKADMAAKLCMAISGNFLAVCHKPPVFKSRKDRITRFMEEHYRQRSTNLDTLAEYLNLSVSRTGKILQQEFNSTFPKLLNQYRFDSAKKLLCETVLNTGVISELCGFSTPQYFYRLFRKTFSITPTEYRRVNTPHNLPEDV